jgi:uroporphyrinogen-III synthase
LTEKLKQQGFGVVECPTLQIETQTVDLQSLNAKVWVFVSRNAVKHFAKQLSVNHQAWWLDKTLVAVGEATAQAMDEQGWGNRQAIPKTYDSEGMLALPAFAKPNGLTVAIVRGNGGRELLAQTLQNAGAQVAFYEVYRRRPAPFCHQAWSLLQQADSAVILFTSVSSMQALWQMLNNEHQAWCLQQTLIVFSERIADAARKLGFKGQIVVTEQCTDQAIVDQLSKMTK